MRVAAIAVAAVLVATWPSMPAFAQETPELSVSLVCEGRGDVKRMTKNYARRKGSDAPAYVAGYQPVAGLVRVEIAGGAGRAQLPKALNPVDDGDWQKIGKLTVDQALVSGRLSTGLLSSARLSIDRATGAFSIRGEMGDFSGICRAAGPAQRAF